jgi:hypothetical protein
MGNKQAYFQGGGGVNEPTPGKKKYHSDEAIVVQPRFKEPFYQNYDLYTIPGMEDVGPGTGWHGLQNYKSVAEFLKARRERLKPRYVADDSWQLDNGERTKKNPKMKARAKLLSRIIKRAIDFPLDETLDPTVGDNQGEEAKGPLGYSDVSTPAYDFEEKSPATLDFGRDYSGSNQYPRGCPNCGFNGDDVDLFDTTYPCPKCHQGGALYAGEGEPPLTPGSEGPYGLPEGIDLPDEDLTNSNNINPDYGTTDSGNTSYQNIWH